MYSGTDHVDFTRENLGSQLDSFKREMRAQAEASREALSKRLFMTSGKVEIWGLPGWLLRLKDTST
jgi:hypothetical protein